MKGGRVSNSIEQADVVCLIFLHAVERELQAVNQNRIWPMVSNLAILSLNVNISLYFSFVRLSLFVFVFHVPSYSTPTQTIQIVIYCTFTLFPASVIFKRISLDICDL